MFWREVAALAALGFHVVFRDACVVFRDVATSTARVCFAIVRPVRLVARARGRDVSRAGGARRLVDGVVRCRRSGASASFSVGSVLSVGDLDRGMARATLVRTTAASRVCTLALRRDVADGAGRLVSSDQQ